MLPFCFKLYKRNIWHSHNSFTSVYSSLQTRTSSWAVDHTSVCSKGVRCNSTQAKGVAVENAKVDHSHFLATASPHAKWNGSGNGNGNGNGAVQSHETELEGVTDKVGKLLPTSSHLFKLILPLRNTPDSESKGQNLVPTVLLLHPAQPLSHVSRLILASLSPQSSPRTISFRNSPSGSAQYRQFQWSDSTDVADFIRDAARAEEFCIHITSSGSDSDSETTKSNDEKDSDGSNQVDHGGQVISVRVPTFADRTRYIRLRLKVIERQLDAMEGLKRECDREAHRGARRMAVGGFGMLIVYWAAVARLTFWDYGWDVMEPVTYLSGLSTVICGYLWFLYQGREVSYSSVLDSSVSSRRQALYKQRGLDIDRWIDLVSERKMLMREIGRIKEDYEQPERGEKDVSDGREEAEEEEEAEERKKERRKEKKEEEEESVKT